MSLWNKHRVLVCVASLALGGCVGETSASIPADSTEQGPGAKGDTDPSDPSSEADIYAASFRRVGGWTSQPGCNSCGYGVPWTPPHDSREPAAPEPDPSRPAD